MPSRRQFMKIVGSSAVVFAATSVLGAGCSQTQRSGPTAPWQEAGRPDDSDPRRRALSYAILAPNPHNRQPWQVDLDHANEIVLYCDPDRLLAETDPFERQILIGLGCFLEVLRMAAAQDGMLATVERFPDGVPANHLDTRPIARIRFRQSKTVQPDPLFAQVLERRTLKEPFDTARPVTEDLLSQISQVVPTSLSVDSTNDPQRVAQLRELSWQAHLLEMTTDRTNMESVRLMRIGRREIEANPDGIDLGGPAMGMLSFLGIVTREKLADPTSTAFKQGLEMYDGILNSAMAYLWITTDGNSRLDQLDAGTAWVRANLKATELGVGIHPLSQSLQEYVEMTELYASIHARLADSGKRIQMFARLGYGPTTNPSPRWPVETRIVHR